ncbi:cystine/glutamate transporter-like isoform X2 [Lepidochelys kempii]|uniref:cystine/glutamate transporter-like isoform X2 n=1 Tax=Lepidochelys kempii TaxID=8472 RepID=UPI003C6F050D
MAFCRKSSNVKEEAVFLRKKITLTRAIALTIGTVVGSGIFIAPKGVLKNSGNVGLSLVVWLACGILSLFGALSYADLGTSITKSGGHYIYLLETLGPLPAFLRLWAEFVMIRPANIAVVSLAFGRYLIEPLFAPCHAPALAVKLVTTTGISLIIALNCWSVSWSANIQTVLAVLKMVTIGLIIVPGMMALAEGYLLTNVSYYAVLTAEEVLASEAVAVSFVDRAFKSVSSAIPILVALSCFGSLNGGIFAAARMLFAASREGQWPPLFSMIHSRRNTPFPALLLMLPLTFLMVLIGDLYGLLNFYSFSRWLFIGLVTLGLMIHRYRHPEIPRPFKVPLFIPLVFTIICLFIVGMSLYSDPVNTGIGCAITLTGLPVYYLVVQKSRIPASCSAMFNSMTVKLQVLMEVIPQEIQTY